MTDLIKIDHDTENPTVSGRELHAFLEVDSNYTTWFSRMTEYGFQEKADYEACFPNLECKNHGGHNKLDHNPRGVRHDA